MAQITRRALLLGTGAVIGAATMRALRSDSPAPDGVALVPPAIPDGMLNDASLLSATPVYRHVMLTEDPGAALIARLRAELADARATGRAVNIGAARHSMGGQAIPKGGHALTFVNPVLAGAARLRLSVDTASGVYRAHAGTRWHAVIADLDPLGRSPKVMQSNNDFGVGATFSVNAHGWPCPFGPMGSTVRRFTMMLADGSIITASRGQNADLFAAAMGGYGLIGLILELEVESAANQRLVPTYARMTAPDFAQAFTAAMVDPAVAMAYGRLNVDRARFFQDALLITYRATADQTDLPPAAGSGFMSRAAGAIYRAQLGNERIKRLRWRFEAGLNPHLSSGEVTRNSLINEPVATLDDGDAGRSDILHEYFVAPDRFGDFLTLCRAVIPQSYQEMLNVTLRHVAADPDAVLAYAPVPRIAAVMSFSQEMSARAESDMARVTAAMIDGMIAIGGTYYLPYRPHATPDQFAAAYPRAAEFAALKRRVDPKLTLRNALWERYLAPL